MFWLYVVKKKKKKWQRNIPCLVCILLLWVFPLGVVLRDIVGICEWNCLFFMPVFSSRTVFDHGILQFRIEFAFATEYLGL